MENPNVPELKRHEGSWAVVRRETGEIVAEFHRSKRELVEQINFDKYEVIGILEWLGRVQKRIDESNTKDK